MDIFLYITDLLNEHDYVIVPGLGVFISSYRPAKFNDDKNILLPPSRTISFNPVLKINDGLLTRYISQQQRITLTQASGQLEKFTGDVLYQLELGKEVFIGNIGTLFQKQGELMFIPVESSPENSESFGLQPVAVSDYGTISGKEEAIPADEKSKKRFSHWIWIGSFLLFFLITLLLYFIFFANRHTVKQTEPVIQRDTLVNKKTAPSISPDSTIFDQNEIKPVPKDTLKLKPGKALYYMIGGSFKSRQNANEFYERMSLREFHPIHLGLIGNYYLVALDTFNTAQEAFNAADQYSQIFRNSKVWIYHPK